MEPLRRGDSVELRHPPHNIGVERALLGSILSRSKTYDQVSDFLRPEHFTDPAAARVYETLGVMIDQGLPCNVVTVKSFLENDEAVRAAGGIKYLVGLASSMVTTGGIQVREYGRQIFDLAVRRELIALGGSLVEAAFDVRPDEGAGDIVGDFEQQLVTLAGSISALDRKGNRDIAASVEAVLQQHMKIDRGEISGVSTGIPILDTQSGLMQAGDMVVLAGRPGQGKSALGGTISYHAARNFLALAQAENKPPQTALVFSGEMTAEQWTARLLTALTGVPAPRSRRTPLGSADWDRLTDVQRDLAGLPLRIIDRAAPTISGILAECRLLAKTGGVGLIVVDYLQIMGVERSRRAENRTQEVSYLARGLKGLAVLIGCPVIVLSQINRGVEQRENKRPGMADLRESGEIEAAADTIHMLFREAHYLEQQKPTKSDEIMKWNSRLEAVRDQAEVIITKARHGTAGVAFLKFDGSRTWFSDPAASVGHQPELGF